jgi:hypothetical protein
MEKLLTANAKTVMPNVPLAMEEMLMSAIHAMLELS